MGKLRVLIMALFSASILFLTGCGWSQTSTLTITGTDTSQVYEISANLSEQPDQPLPASDLTEAAAADAADTAAVADAKTIAPAITEASAITTPAPVTAADISALPVGTIVDDFLISDEIINGCFYFEEISDDVFARMDGNSYKEDCTVPLSDLRYARVLYYGFDNSVHIGELVVNKKIAEDIMEIFRGLYNEEYPIGKMVLVDEYGGDDNASMLDNNTSAFNYRAVNGTTTLSKHAAGMAIDINPLYNPWIYELDGKTVIDPPAGAEYADRTLDCPYYLDHEDLCYMLFIDHGFTWGGDWDSSKDYQHFSKDINT